MDAKQKMQALINKKKQSGNRPANQVATAKNDRKNMRKGPKIFNK